MASHPEFGKETPSERVVDAIAQEIRGRVEIITGVSPNTLGEAMARDNIQGPITAGPHRPVHKQSREVSQVLGVDLSSVKRRVLSLDLSSQMSVRENMT